MASFVAGIGLGSLSVHALASRLKMGHRLQCPPSEDGSQRPLSTLEQWYSSQFVQHIFTCSVEMLLNNDAIDLDSLIQDALQHVIASHPTLRSRLVPSSSSSAPPHQSEYASFELIPIDTLSISLISHNVTNKTEFLSILQKTMDTAFDLSSPSQPLWRFFSFHMPDKSVVLSVAFHHVLADGLSGPAFFKNLFSAMSSILSASSPSPPIIPTSFSEKSAKNVLDERLDLRPALSELLAAAVPSPIKSLFSTQYWTKLLFKKQPAGNAVGPPQLPRQKLASKLTTGKIHLVQLNLVQMKKLRQASKQNGTTIHAALVAAASIAFYSVFKSAPWAKDHMNVSVAVPLNLRSLCRPVVDDKQIGCFICGIDTDQIVTGSEDVWTLARKHKSQLSSAFPFAFRKLGMLQFVGNLKQYIRKSTAHLPNFRSTSLEVSNLGSITFDIPAVLGLKLNAVYFAQANGYDTPSPLLNISVATLDSGALTCTISHAHQLTKEDEADAFETEFAKELTKLCS